MAERFLYTFMVISLFASLLVFTCVAYLMRHAKNTAPAVQPSDDGTPAKDDSADQCKDTDTQPKDDPNKDGSAVVDTKTDQPADGTAPVDTKTDQPADKTANPGITPRPVTVVVTSANKRLSIQEPVAFGAGACDATLPTIKVNPGKTYQKWVGMGAALTHSAALNLGRLPEDDLDRVLKNIFGDLNLNLFRLCIGASDYADHVFSLCDSKATDEILAHFTELFNQQNGTHYAVLQKADPELKGFNIDYDKKHVIPLLRKALAINPELRLFASPWSPPGWMKGNNTMLGGCMQRKHMGSYARYFVYFIKNFEEQGVPIWAVTVQNEVDTDQDGNMPACVWPSEYESDFIAYHLGPAFEVHNVKTKIWAIDHNPNNWGRAMSMAEVPEVAKYIDAFAWHDYRGARDKFTLVHDAFPSIDAYWTEGGPDWDKPDYGTNWTHWGKVITGAARNWCRGWTAWNLALDERGLPKVGPFNCGGMITVHSITKEITYSGQYWATAQFSKYVQRDAMRIVSEGDIAAIDHVAFTNPDGKTVLVITNSAEARTVNVEMAGATMQIALDADSVTTCVW